MTKAIDSKKIFINSYISVANDELRSEKDMYLVGFNVTKNHKQKNTPKLVLIILFISILYVSTIFLVNTASAVTPHSQTTHTWSDNFNNNEISQNWTITKEYWYEANGYLVQDSHGTGTILNSNATITQRNYTVSTLAKMAGRDQNYVSVLLRSDATGKNAVEARINWTNDTLEIGRLRNGIYTPIATENYSKTTNSVIDTLFWYSITAKINGNTVRLKVSEPRSSAVLTTTSPEFDLPGGYIGLKGKDGDRGDKNLFDSFTVGKNPIAIYGKRPVNSSVQIGPDTSNKGTSRFSFHGKPGDTLHWNHSSQGVETRFKVSDDSLNVDLSINNYTDTAIKGTPVKLFDLSAQNLSFSNATIRIHYNDTDIAELEENSLRLYHRKNGAWHLVPTTINTTANYVEGTVTSLSPFAVTGTSPGDPAVTANISASGAPPGDTTNYTLTVTSHHNVTDTINLNASSTNSTWNISLSNTSVTLGPGNSTTVNLSVTIPGNATYDQYANITVTATSLRNASTQTYYQTTMTHFLNGTHTGTAAETGNVTLNTTLNGTYTSPTIDTELGNGTYSTLWFNTTLPTTTTQNRTITTQSDWNNGTLSDGVETDRNPGDLWLGYKNGSTGDSMKGYWRLNENSTGNVTDTSGEGNTGSTQSFEGDEFIDGALGTGAFYFDGSDDTVGYSLGTVPTNTFTLEFWANPNATHEIDSESTSGYAGTSGQKYAFGADHRGSDAGAGVSVGTNGISVYEHGSSYMPPLAVYSGTLSGWNHIVIVYNNKQPSIYLNGDPVRTGLTSPKTTVYAPASTFGGGAYGHYKGALDNVKIHNKSLNTSEINAHYNGTNPLNENFGGTHTSEFHDFNSSTSFTSFTPNATVPATTSINYTFRSSPDGTTGNASQWYSDITQVPNSRYLQVRANLSTTDVTKSPTLHDYAIPVQSSTGLEINVTASPDQTLGDGDDVSRTFNATDGNSTYPYSWMNGYRYVRATFNLSTNDANMSPVLHDWGLTRLSGNATDTVTVETTAERPTYAVSGDVRDGNGNPLNASISLIAPNGSIMNLSSGTNFNLTGKQGWFLDLNASGTTGVEARFTLSGDSTNSTITLDNHTTNPAPTTPPGVNPVKYGTVSAQNLSYSEVRVRLHYDENLIAPYTTEENLWLRHYKNGWTTVSTTRNTSANYVQGTVTSLSDFAATGTSTPGDPSITAEPDGLDVAPGYTANYTLTVTNDDNQSDTIHLNATITNTSWNHSLSDSSVTLDPGQSTDVTLLVTIPTNASDTTHANVTITATSSRNASRQTYYQTTTAHFENGTHDGTENSAPGSVGMLSYSDDFTDSTISNDWNVSNGTWTETGGEMRQDSNGTGILSNINATDPEDIITGATDYNASVNMKIQGDDQHYTALLLRSDGNGRNNVEARLNFTNDSIEISYLAENNRTLIAATPFTLDDDEWHAVNVSLRGSTVRLRVEDLTGGSGSATVQATNSSFNYPYTRIDLKGEEDDSTGTSSSPAWNSTYDAGNVGGNDDANDIVADSNGNIYVTGHSDLGASSGDYYTIKYNSTTGGVVWTKSYDGGSTDQAHGITTDSTGNVYVTGDSNRDYHTIKYDSAGTKQWSTTYDSGNNDYAQDVAVDSNGNVYITGQSHDGSTWNYRTIKYDSSGTEQWNATHDSGDQDYGYGIAVDNNGSVYVTGDSNSTYYTVKYNSSTGAEQWNVTGGGGYAYDVAVDANGNIYVTGERGWDRDFWTYKYDPAGAEQWTAISDPSITGHERGYGIALDTHGNVYVTGESGSGYFTAKYNSSTGTETWNATYSSDSYADGVATDPDGNVYVTGMKNFNYTTLRYNYTGKDDVNLFDNFRVWTESGEYVSPMIDTDVNDANYNTSSLWFNATVPTGTTLNVTVNGSQDTAFGNRDDVTQTFSISDGNNTYATDWLDGHRYIRIRANFSSQVQATTPELHGWGLTREPGTPRDNVTVTATSTEPRYGVEINITPPSEDVFPGGNYSFTVEVKNNGTLSDNLTLTTVDTGDTEYFSSTLSKTTFDLPFPGKSTTTTLTMSAVPGTPYGSNMTTRVTGTSQGNASRTGSDTATGHVRSPYSRILRVVTNRYVVLDDPNTGNPSTDFNSVPQSWNSEYWFGESTTVRPYAMVHDQYGEPLVNETVRFVVKDWDGNEHLNTTTTTDSAGIANASLDLNDINYWGFWTVQASAGNSSNSTYVSNSTRFIKNWWGCANCHGDKAAMLTYGPRFASKRSPYTQGYYPAHRDEPWSYCMQSAVNDERCTFCHQGYGGNDPAYDDSYDGQYPWGAMRNDVKCPDCHTETGNGSWIANGGDDGSGLPRMPSCFESDCHNIVNQKVNPWRTTDYSHNRSQYSRVWKHSGELVYQAKFKYYTDNWTIGGNSDHDGDGFNGTAKETKHVSSSGQFGLALMHDRVNVTLPKINLSGRRQQDDVSLSAHVWPGGGTIRFSGDVVTPDGEYPGTGVDLQVLYLNKTDQWVELERFPGGVALAGQEHIEEWNLGKDALHENFTIRLRMTNGTENVMWHVDDVTIQAAGRPIGEPLKGHSVYEDGGGVPCIMCHGPMHNVTTPYPAGQGNDETEKEQCYQCHIEVKHPFFEGVESPQPCTDCHTQNIHNISGSLRIRDRATAAEYDNSRELSFKDDPAWGLWQRWELAYNDTYNASLDPYRPESVQKETCESCHVGSNQKRGVHRLNLNFTASNSSHHTYFAWNSTGLNCIGCHRSKLNTENTKQEIHSAHPASYNGTRDPCGTCHRDGTRKDGGSAELPKQNLTSGTYNVTVFGVNRTYNASQEQTCQQCHGDWHRNPQFNSSTFLTLSQGLDETLQAGATTEYNWTLTSKSDWENGDLNGTETDYSPGDVKLGYRNGTPGDNLVLYYRLENTSGPFVDDSGEGNDATLSSEVTRGVEGLLGTKANNVSTRDGYHTGITVPDSDSTSMHGQENVTVSIWIKLDSLPSSSANIVNKRNPYTIQLDSPGSGSDFAFRIYNGTGYAPRAQTSIEATVGEWQHVVGTYDGSQIKIYLNGNLKDSQLRTGGMVDVNNSMRIGNGIDGKFDEVRIYNRSLSAAEVRALYNGTGAPGTSFSGNHTTEFRDFGLPVTYKSATFGVNTSTNTSIGHRYRTSTDGTSATASQWYTDITNLPKARYLQVRTILSTTNVSLSPYLLNITVIAESDSTNTEYNGSFPGPKTAINSTASPGITGYSNCTDSPCHLSTAHEAMNPAASGDRYPQHDSGGSPGCDGCHSLNKWGSHMEALTDLYSNNSTLPIRSACDTCHFEARRDEGYISNIYVPFD